MTESMASSSGKLDVKEAWRILVEVVTNLRRRGRSTRSAGVKPAMQVATAGRFNETQLGFPNFRSFLLRAEANGLVRLVPIDGSPDVDVQVVEAKGDGSEIARRIDDGPIRQDLWEAFVRWDDGSTRFWDPTTGVASNDKVRVPPEKFIPITPISHSQMMQWMSEFAGHQAPNARSKLIAGLESEAPFRSFVATAAELEIRPLWLSALRRHVHSTIAIWAREHEVDIHPGSGSTGEASISESIPSSDLRTRVLAYVAAMTDAELLSVPVPMRLLV